MRIRKSKKEKLEISEKLGETNDKKSAKKNKKPKRSKKIDVICIVMAVVLIAVGFGSYIRNNKTHYKIGYYQVVSSHVSENLRIAFISDLHMREYGDKNKTLISDIKSLDPDLIILGGDLVTYGENNYQTMLDFCKKLSLVAPLYGVMGNHENEMVYLDNDTSLPDKFINAGVKLLRNQSETITIGDNTVEIVGLSGDVDEFTKYGGKAFMDSLPKEHSSFRICVDHVPMVFKEKLQNYSFDLGLAGHVHGGIIRLPIVGALYSAEEGLFPEMSSGLYELENAPLIISRGLGDSEIVPRINNSPELVVVDVKWY